MLLLEKSRLPTPKPAQAAMRLGPCRATAKACRDCAIMQKNS
jgi:hypothetical protein